MNDHGTPTRCHLCGGLHEPVDIRLRGRDKKAAAFYRFARWFARHHRNDLWHDMTIGLRDWVLYGRAPR